jgi:streptogramin lyase
MAAQHRWITPKEIAWDGTLWFTESAGNRIGRMNPDASGLKDQGGRCD